MAEKKSEDQSSSSSFRTFLFFPSIKGDCTEAAYKNWVEINSLQWGAGCGVSMGRYGVTDSDSEQEENPRQISDASLSEVSVSKEMSRDSPHIFFHMLSKKDLGSVIIEGATQREDKFVKLFRYVLDDVYSSGYSTNWSKQREKPFENLTLSYGIISMEIFDENGKGSDVVKYDLMTRTTWMNNEEFKREKKKKKKNEDEE